MLYASLKIELLKAKRKEKEKETLFLYEIKQEITRYKDRLLGSLLFVSHGSSRSSGITLDRAIALDEARNPNPHH